MLLHFLIVSMRHKIRPFTLKETLMSGVTRTNERNESFYP